MWLGDDKQNIGRIHILNLPICKGELVARSGLHTKKKEGGLKEEANRQRRKKNSEERNACILFENCDLKFIACHTVTLS